MSHRATTPPPSVPALVSKVHGHGCSLRMKIHHSKLPNPGVLRAEGMTCRDAARVLTRVSPRLEDNYYDRLEHIRNEAIAGYRCSAFLVGDASWLIVCRRGAQAVLAAAAE
jgi:hypothetical protein